VNWDVTPEPRDAGEREALLQAAEQALAGVAESRWWRSGLDDLDGLGGGPAAEQLWRDPGVVEA
jgi:hypothetical protein